VGLAGIRYFGNAYFLTFYSEGIVREVVFPVVGSRRCATSLENGRRDTPASFFQVGSFGSFTWPELIMPMAFSGPAGKGPQGLGDTLPSNDVAFALHAELQELGAIPQLAGGRRCFLLKSYMEVRPVSLQRRWRQRADSLNWSKFT
jgi:hypothetical protein